MKGNILALLVTFSAFTVSKATDELIQRTKEDCMLPMKVGTCRAMIPAYFYNAETRQCTYFAYGGCGGNNNRFYEFQECADFCGNEIKSDPASPKNLKTSNAAKFGHSSIYLLVISGWLINFAVAD